MKQILIVLVILIAVSLSAEDQIDYRSALHFGAGVITHSSTFLALSSSTKLSQSSIEDISVFISFTAGFAYEYYGNCSFWDLTFHCFGMAVSHEIWKDRRPIVYPKYYGKKWNRH